MCLNKQDFEYASSRIHTELLNMAEFEFVRVTQGSKYTTICLNMSE